MPAGAGIAGTHASGRAVKKLELFHPTRTKYTNTKEWPEVNPKSKVWQACGTGVHQNDREMTLALATCTCSHVHTRIICAIDRTQTGDNLRPLV